LKRTSHCSMIDGQSLEWREFTDNIWLPFARYRIPYPHLATCPVVGGALTYRIYSTREIHHQSNVTQRDKRENHAVVDRCAFLDTSSTATTPTTSSRKHAEHHLKRCFRHGCNCRGSCRSHLHCVQQLSVHYLACCKPPTVLDGRVLTRVVTSRFLLT
jgi:hypothetical protein